MNTSPTRQSKQDFFAGGAGAGEGKEQATTPGSGEATASAAETETAQASVVVAGGGDERPCLHATVLAYTKQLLHRSRFHIQYKDEKGDEKLEFVVLDHGCNGGSDS